MDLSPSRVWHARARMNRAIRRSMDAAGFLEVETPIAVPSPGLEAHLDAFAVSGAATGGRAFLHTSPEFAMKKLLAAGSGSIYQIARVFRDEPASATHRPEFSMLEFYRSPGDIDDVQRETVALIDAVAAAVDGAWRPGEHDCLSVSDAFRRVGLPCPLEHPDPAAFRAALALRSAPDDTWDDLFFRAFLEKVEPSFPPDRVTVLTDYPAQMAALAELHPDDPRRALRFEVFVGATELGNAFQELRDPVEQRRRFERDRSLRQQAGKRAYPIDEALLAALPSMPPTSGIALGLDRLLMVCLGAPNLDLITPKTELSP